MKTNITILTALVLLLSITLNAQVAINTDGTSPDASTMLDIQSTNRGTSFPNLNIANMSTADPVTSPKTGLIAYNTNGTTGPGLVMWTGSRWVMFELQGTCWSLTGNAGTTVGTNFIGTTDNVDFATYTNNAERMRVASTGEVVVNRTSPLYLGDIFSSHAAGGDWAINGYAATGTAIFGQTSGSSGFGVYADNNHASGTAIIASGNNYSASYLTNGTGIAGSGGDGIYGKGKDSDGTGIIGVGNNGDSTFTLVGGTGGSFTGASGIYAKVDNNSTGTGVIGAGYHVSSVATTTTGSGGAFTGYQGVYGKAVSPTGTGVIGVGNNGSGYYIYSGTVGSGGAFTGAEVGVYGYATNTGGNNGNPINRAGGYFQDNNTYAIVGGTWNNTSYGILSNGTKSTIVKDLNENPVVMYCPEAPEVLFQDYGIGQLNNGRVHIVLDPVLTKNIRVDENHPLKVFVTLEGDCNGVYITNKSVNGFDVVELQGGTSDVPFSWQIVATRASEEYVNKDGSKEYSDYSKRFPPAPSKPEQKMEKGATHKHESIQHKSIDINDPKEGNGTSNKVMD
jgi:hypothetical protein